MKQMQRKIFILLFGFSGVFTSQGSDAKDKTNIDNSTQGYDFDQSALETEQKENLRLIKTIQTKALRVKKMQPKITLNENAEKINLITQEFQKQKLSNYSLENLKFPGFSFNPRDDPKYD